MEYTKQLILSCLLNICQKLSPEGGRIPRGATLLEASGGRIVCSECECTYHLEMSYFCLVDILDEEKFNVELIVQCIRVSEMCLRPITHALLLLGTVAGIFPVSVNDLRLMQILWMFSSVEPYRRTWLGFCGILDLTVQVGLPGLPL